MSGKGVMLDANGFNKELTESFRTLVRNRLQILRIFGENSHTWEDQRDWGNIFCPPRYIRDNYCRIEVLKDSNHTFALAAAQSELLDKVVEFFDRVLRTPACDRATGQAEG